MQVFAKWYSYKDESDKPLLAHKGPYSRPISRKASGVCGALHFHCTLHTSNNCKQYHQSKYDRNDIWAIQGCQTEGTYKKSLNNLRSKCSRAADYIAKIDPKTWCPWPHFKTRTLYGNRTSCRMVSQQPIQL
ncbi:hypothetical protein XU18_2118 [Perkinsela sp. CCAP 1560/4]|nr:hypothetical protein XU18_2118 [Perkinsela sp. CCAP 1560/4]|eukprot:KNH07182.1 hypothetical protein XU18_2118 [Perkinsela sp. CCAP 1560/4]